MSLATNYFKNFNYTIDNNVIVTNLLNRAALKNIDVITKTKIYLPYLIKDGERPENIAEAYYGSTTYFWIIMFANNIRNLYEDWPRTQEVFDNYIIKKYGGLSYATQNIDHYEDESGNWVMGTEPLCTGITIYDYETQLNEKKRVINLIRVEYKGQLIKEFQNIFK